jgi:hypothetical protein
MSDQKLTPEVQQDAATTPSIEATVTRSPRTHIDSSPLPTDSMVTVPLSEADGASTEDDEEGARESMIRPKITVDVQRTSSRTNSSEIRKAFGRRSSEASVETPATESPAVSTDATPISPKTSNTSRRNSDGSGHSEHVDWAELEKKEEQEPDREEEVRLCEFAYTQWSRLTLTRPWPYY